jgi:hypothetical protein
MVGYITTYRYLSPQWWLKVALLLVAVASPVVMAQQPAEEERLLKAAFIYNFAKFTRWPEGTWDDDQASLNLCIAGTDELVTELELLGGKVVKGRSLTVTRLNEQNVAESCHIIYVATSESTNDLTITHTLRDKAVLTVSEIPHFARSGGTIELFRKEGRVRFIINLDVVRKSGLEISSRLLNLAEIVGQKAAP